MSYRQEVPSCCNTESRTIIIVHGHATSSCLLFPIYGHNTRKGRYSLSFYHLIFKRNVSLIIVKIVFFVAVSIKSRKIGTIQRTVGFLRRKDSFVAILRVFNGRLKAIVILIKSISDWAFKIN